MFVLSNRYVNMYKYFKDKWIPLDMWKYFKDGCMPLEGDYCLLGDDEDWFLIPYLFRGGVFVDWEGFPFSGEATRFLVIPDNN